MKLEYEGFGGCVDFRFRAGSMNHRGFSLTSREEKMYKLWNFLHNLDGIVRVIHSYSFAC